MRIYKPIYNKRYPSKYMVVSMFSIIVETHYLGCNAVEGDDIITDYIITICLV